MKYFKATFVNGKCFRFWATSYDAAWRYAEKFGVAVEDVDYEPFPTYRLI